MVVRGKLWVGEFFWLWNTRNGGNSKEVEILCGGFFDFFFFWMEGCGDCSRIKEKFYIYKVI